MPTFRELREEALLTQTELARACGVSHQTVWDWEHGNSTPSIRNRRKLVEALGSNAREINAAIQETAKEAKKEQAAA